jgi:two-component system, sensor histidine kinase and response regulator
MNGDILLIDDKPANLQVLTAMLKERGHKVRAVTSGDMGLVVARSASPDLILLDINMPHMNGYEVCRRLKADPQVQHIPVIFISALDDTIDKVQAFEVGGTDYISKPFHVQEVLVRVENQLKLHHLYRHVQQIAATEERQRIARELHDSVSQTLFSAHTMAGTLLMINDESKVRSGLERLRELTGGALAEMRTLLVELRPDALQGIGLDELLHLLVRSLTSHTGANVETVLDCDHDLPPDVKITFYRITQEIFSNIIKHANARNVLIELRTTEGTMRLCVQDDGTGFDLSATFAGHFGLAIMRERAESIGAMLTIDSAPGEGTSIVCTWTAVDGALHE